MQGNKPEVKPGVTGCKSTAVANVANFDPVDALKPVLDASEDQQKLQVLAYLLASVKGGKFGKGFKGKDVGFMQCPS